MYLLCKNPIVASMDCRYIADVGPLDVHVWHAPPRESLWNRLTALREAFFFDPYILFCLL